MKNLHFWYSVKMAQFLKDEGEKLNVCVIRSSGEKFYTVYTHASCKYSRGGGADWGDEVYLGMGDIVSVNLSSVPKYH